MSEHFETEPARQGRSGDLIYAIESLTAANENYEQRATIRGRDAADRIGTFLTVLDVVEARTIRDALRPLDTPESRTLVEYLDAVLDSISRTVGRDLR